MCDVLVAAEMAQAALSAVRAVRHPDEDVLPQCLQARVRIGF
eukprot:gene10065-12865_t